MLYGKIEGVNKPVSRIFCGTASKAFMNGEDCSEYLNGVLALGVNALDTARVYKKAESAIGNWLEKSGKREEVVILSKCAHPNILGGKRVNERAIKADFARSLSELKTNYIDIYILHRDDVNVPVGRLVETFNGLIAEDRIKAYGCSNWTVRRIAEAEEYAYKHNLVPFALSSPYFSLAEQYGDPWGGGCVSIAGPAHEADRKWYAERQMAVLAYSSLARGVLSGAVKSTDYDKAQSLFDRVTLKGYVSRDNFERLRRCEEIALARGASVSQIALAYVLCSGMNAFAAVSCSTVERMRQNASAAGIVLSDEEIKFLECSAD